MLQLRWNGDTFLFDLFEDGLRGMIHSTGINSLDFGFATLLVALETIGFGKRGTTSLTSKASTVFGQVLDVTEMVIVQVGSEGGLALSLDRMSVGRWTSSTFPSSPKDYTNVCMPKSLSRACPSNARPQNSRDAPAWPSSSRAILGSFLPNFSNRNPGVAPSTSGRHTTCQSSCLFPAHTDLDSRPATWATGP